MLFASKNAKERLLHLGSRMQKLVSSSYLGELDALVWACKKTKAFWGTIPVVVRTDNQSLMEKWQSRSLYDSDIRTFFRWSWFGANEPGLEIEFMQGSENIEADLLSRPLLSKGQKDFPRLELVVHQFSVCHEIWEEHMRGNWGVCRTYQALQRTGYSATREMVKKVYDLCAVCAQFCHQRARAPLGPPFFSLESGHSMFGDIIVSCKRWGDVYSLSSGHRHPSGRRHAA